ncbi:uncharacterized protein LOC111640744 [Centruroides sculpturatus]|uniref:uncharacterized protein LOC111640744 n=1 Tax=Centruroides sculpturatus TaxID=218467 RepID=UPI000C6E936A|nr:uncharacterized protein LOC111640744 [Centruroides sculpturatus]
MNHVENNIKKNIKPSNLKIRVKGVRQVKGDRLCFRMDTHKEAQILEDAIKKLPDIPNQVNCRISEDRRPRVILTNVPTSVDEEDIISYIYDQNEELQTINRDDFTENTRISTVLFRSNNKENCRHIVLSTSPSIRNVLVRTKHIALQWAKIYINDYIPLVRCYQCCGYNHLSVNCPAKQKCSHCGKGHRFVECRRLDHPPNCANCKMANKDLPDQEKYPTYHNAFNPNCPITIKMKALTIRQTNYGV